MCGEMQLPLRRSRDACTQAQQPGCAEFNTCQFAAGACEELLRHIPACQLASRLNQTIIAPHAVSMHRSQSSLANVLPRHKHLHVHHTISVAVIAQLVIPVGSHLIQLPSCAGDQYTASVG